MLRGFKLKLFKYLQKQFRNEIILSNQQNEEFPYVIEIENGEVISSSGFPANQTNSINTTKYGYWTGPFKLVLNFFQRLGNILYTIIFIVMVSDNQRYSNEDAVSDLNQKLVSYLLAMCVQFSIFASKELYYDLQKYRQDQQINDRQVTVFRRMRKYFQLPQKEPEKEDPTPPALPMSYYERRRSVTSQKFTHMLAQMKPKTSKIPIYEINKWRDLEVGDIVYLKKFETCPADILILDISERDCLVLNQNLTGQNKEVLKFPPELTHVPSIRMKLNGLEYKKMLTGLIKYDKRETDGSLGFIRLKKDPKGEDISLKNIIKRESVLTGCDFVFGMVLLVGKDCQCYQFAKSEKDRKKSFFLAKSDMYFLLNFFNILLITMISWIVSDYSLCRQFDHSEQTNFYLQSSTFVFYLTNYSYSVPHYFYAILDVLELMNAIYKKYRFSLKTINLRIFQKQDSKISAVDSPVIIRRSVPKLNLKYKQLNSCSIADLVMTEYICFDKTGTLTTDQLKIKTILIDERIYKFSSKKIRINGWNHYKKTLDHQIAENKLASEDSFDDEVKKGGFRLTLVNGGNQSVKKKSRYTFSGQDIQRTHSQRRFQMNDSTPISSQNIGVTRIIRSQEQRLPSIRLENSKKLSPLDETYELLENIKVEELEDSHYRMSEAAKNQRPKPFLNRVPLSHPQESDLMAIPSDMPLIQIFGNAENSNLDSSPVIERIPNGNGTTPNNRASEIQRRSDQLSRRSQFVRKSYNISNHGTKSMGPKIEENFESDLLFFEDQEEFYKKMNIGFTQISYQESVLAMTLCHFTKTKFLSTEDSFVNDAKSQLDNQLLKFASLMDIKFICSSVFQNKLLYVIQMKSDLFEFQILSFHKESKNHPRLGVLVKFPETLQEKFGFHNVEDNAEQEFLSSMLIVREEVISLPTYIELEKNAREYWDKYLNRIHQNGYKTVIYAKTYLTEAETQTYLECYESIRQQFGTETEDFEELFTSVEKNMSLISVVGVEEKLRKNAVETVRFATESGLKPWILSGDKFINVLPVAHKIKMLDKTVPSLMFDSGDYEEIKALIRNNLQIMNNQLKTSGLKNEYRSIRASISKANAMNIQNIDMEKKSLKQNSLKKSQHAVEGGKYKNPKQSYQKNSLFFNEIKGQNLFVSGKCFQVICSDKFLYNHFCFLAYFSKSLIGFELTSFQKGRLINIIQKHFPGNKKVLAIGDAYNDMIMFQQADIGVQLLGNVHGFDLHKDRLEQFQRKNSAFQIKTKFFKRISDSINRMSQEQNPTKKVFINRKLWQIPTGDILFSKFEDIQWLLFFESRIFAEIFEDLLMYSFYRGSMIGYTQLIWYCYFCLQNRRIFKFEWFMFYQTVQLFTIFGYHIYLKFTRQAIDYESHDVGLYQSQFKNNVRLFRKKKVLTFIFKVNMDALFEAGILFGFVSNQLSQTSSLTGNALDQDTYGWFVFVGVLVSDLVKFLVFADLNRKQGFMAFLAYMLLVVFLTIITISQSNYSTQHGDIQLILLDPAFLMIAICYLFVQIIIQNFYYAIFSPFFTNPVISDRAQYDNLVENVLESEPFSSEKLGEKVGTIFRKISNLVAKIFQENDEMDLILQQLISGGNSVGNEKLNPFTLQFSIAEVENKFRRLLIVVWMNFSRKQQIISLCLYELTLILINTLTKEIYDAFFVLFILGFSLQMIINWMIWTERYEKHFFKVNLIIFCIRIGCKVLYDILGGSFYLLRDNILLTQLCSYMVIFIIIDRPLVNLFGCLIQTISFMARYSTLWQSETKIMLLNYYMVLNSNIIAFGSFVALAITKYRIVYMERIDYLLDNSMKQETQQINDVLAILLPKFIRDRIDQQGQFDVAESQGDVSILFCDICQFDKIINTEREKIVLLLDNLFRAFDQLCADNGMQKIETVGKTYMAAGGLKAVDQNSKFAGIHPVQRAISQAVEMQRFVQKFKFGKVGNLQIKIGIHYGRVIAGVIGHHKPQFSLIGDIVNTTSRVCSTGEDGTITISEKAYEEIDMPELNFDQKIVEAKGKGKIVTYQVSTEIKRSRRFRRQKLPAKKINKKVSVNIINEEDNNSDHKSSQNLDHSVEIKTLLARKRTNKTRILKNQASGHSFFRQASVFKSINQIESNTPKIQTLHPTVKEESEHGGDRQNLIQVLETQLRKELIIEHQEENVDFEIDRERAKTQFLIEDDKFTDQKVEALILSKSKLYLDFDSHQEALANEFHQMIAQSDQRLCKLVLWFSTFCFSIKSFSIFMIYDQIHTQIQQSANILRITVSIMQFALCFALSSRYKTKAYKEYILIIYFGAKFWIYIFESCVQENNQIGELQISEGIFLISIFTSIQLIRVHKKFLMLITFLMSMIIIIAVQSWPWRYFYYVFICSLIQFGLQYRSFLIQINNYNNKLLLEHKQQQQGNLVMYLLPQHILDEFFRPNQQRKALTDYCQDSTLLFADIAGFTEYSSQVEPEQVVNMLRNLFTEFDRTCLQQNTYKLYTIGDCYVVMGMTDANDRQPAKEAKAVVELGFLMIDIIRQVRLVINFEGLDMRIGVHTGNIIGGVLGTEIVRYDIYGEDVMIANKMESNGAKGHVQVSEETKLLLESTYPYDFIFEFNKTIEFTSIGRKTNGYFVFPSENNQSASEGSKLSSIQ